ncbi:hypothetical protein VPH35_075420 [Triticum aestivum]
MAGSDVAPWLRISSNPILFAPLGFLYGLGGAIGRGRHRLVRAEHGRTLWLRGGGPRRRDALITPRHRGPLVHQEARRGLQQRTSGLQQLTKAPPGRYIFLDPGSCSFFFFFFLESVCYAPAMWASQDQGLS